MAILLFGSVWQRIALILLICTHAGFVRTQEGPAGEAEEEDTVRAGDIDEAIIVERSKICRYMGSEIDRQITRAPELYAHWPQSRYAFSNLFSGKPLTPHRSTVCFGMNTTCCKPQAEKLLHTTAKLDYKKVYRDVLQEHFSECSNAARNLYHALYDKFMESHRLLEAEMSEILPSKLPEGVFQELFKYLTTFIHHPDFCPLREHVQSLAQELFNSVYFAQLTDEHSVDTDSICLRNVSSAFVQGYVEEIAVSLERLLVDVELFVESIEIAEEIMGTVKEHSFSTPCVYALTRLKYCALCGGHTEFPACLSFCLNVFRGCLADVAELYDDFAEFHEILKTFSDRLVSDLQPQMILASSLQKIVGLVEALKREDLTALVSFECDLPQIFRRKRNSLQTTIPQTSSPVITTTAYTDADIAFDPLPNAMVGQLSCVEDLEMLLDSLPEEMCYLSKNHVGSSRNDHCWTGTVLGRYEDALIGKSKAEQVNNPAFIREHMDTDLLYREQMLKLADLTMRINESMQLKLCLENHELDCSLQQVLCKEPEVVMDECTGSGCGSAEEESSSGLGDLEEGDEEEPDEEHEDVNRPNSEIFEDKWTPDPDSISTDDIDTDPIVIFNDTDPLNNTDTTHIFNDNDDTDPIEIIELDDDVTPPNTDNETPKLSDNLFDDSSSSPPIHRTHYLISPLLLFALYLL